MRERGIIFNSEMVRAVLDGRKTQTRRIVKSPCMEIVEKDDGTYRPWRERDDGGDYWYPCPLGQPGDRLWVRETWQAIHDSTDEHGNVEDRTWMPSILKKPDSYWHPVYAASGGNEDRETRGFPWRPSIHMPRWASRITLEITGVRVERLQDISEADALAEGVDPIILDDSQDRYDMVADHNLTGRPTAVDSFAGLWESIYGADSWQDNPWVWVIEFRRVEQESAA